jgi:hypothetical protein
VGPFLTVCWQTTGVVARWVAVQVGYVKDEQVSATVVGVADTVRAIGQLRDQPWGLCVGRDFVVRAVPALLWHPGGERDPARIRTPGRCFGPQRSVGQQHRLTAADFDDVQLGLALLLRSEERDPAAVRG